jgi:hypothetical protein
MVEGFRALGCDNDIVVSVRDKYTIHDMCREIYIYFNNNVDR